MNITIKNTNKEMWQKIIRSFVHGGDGFEIRCWEGENEEQTITNISKDVEESEPLYIVGGIENDTATLETSLTGFQNFKTRVAT